LGLFGFDLHEAGVDLRTERRTQYNQVPTKLNANNIFSSIKDKVRDLRNMFAQRNEIEEVVMACAA